MLKSGDPDGKYWMPAMSDAPLRGYNGRHEWFWEPGDEEHIYPLDNLMDIYENSVGHNSTLIMGLTPDPNGLMPEPDALRLKEWGDEIQRKFGNPIAETSGESEKISLKIKGDQKVNYLILKEDIRFGERVREYQVEAKTKGRWVEITDGTCIGHKRIIKLNPDNYTGIRISISKSIDTPKILSLAAY